jgi:hypothetical protein
MLLLVLGVVGGAALVAGGIWQRAAGSTSRVFVLVVAAALSAAYVVANVIGLLVVASATEPVPGLSRVPWGLWVGTALGGLLYLLTLVEGLTALRERDRALEEWMDR